MEGLIPPSHFVLRSRSLGAELGAEKGRGHDLEAELKALKGRSQRLEAELEAEKGRSQRLEAELEAEKGRSQRLEAELEAERGRSQRLEAELEAEKGRSKTMEVELNALRGRSQRVEAELEAEKGRSQTLEMEIEAEKGRSQNLEAEKGRSQHLEVELEAEKGRSQILQMELEALRGRSFGKEGAEPSPEQVLLARWRQKVFQLLLQVRLQRSQELRLQGQVRSLDAAVAAGSRQVSLLELRLRRGEEELRGERQAVSQQRLRAEAAEEQLGKLGETLSRALLSLSLSLAGVTAALGALGTLSERLARTRDRLRALVASGRLRVTARDRATVTSQVTSEVTSEVTSDQPRGWHAGDTGGGGSVPKVSPQCHPRVTPGRDGSRTQPDTVSLAPLLTQLQALGAAILGDSGDVIKGTAVTSLGGQL